MAGVSTDNPCISCGACCAHFRVSFYWGECASAGGCVPDELTERLPPHRVNMKGTGVKPARCIALSGEVGGPTLCGIYENRPSVCRDFKASYAEDGSFQEGCDQARAAYGLPPLQPVEPANNPDDHNNAPRTPRTPRTPKAA
ncbi:MAG: YkgJ family cysteine cluster protein [Campylobacterales bacterium]